MRIAIMMTGVASALSTSIPETLHGLNSQHVRFRPGIEKRLAIKVLRHEKISPPHDEPGGPEEPEHDEHGEGRQDVHLGVAEAPQILVLFLNHSLQGLPLLFVPVILVSTPEARDAEKVDLEVDPGDDEAQE